VANFEHLEGQIEVHVRSEPPKCTNLQIHRAASACRLAYMNLDSDEAGEHLRNFSNVVYGDPTGTDARYIMAFTHDNEVYTAYRGTATPHKLLQEVKAWATDLGVHAGFYGQMQIVDKALILSYFTDPNNKAVILCGHSLGAAAAAVRLYSICDALDVSCHEAMIGFGVPLFSTDTTCIHNQTNLRNLFHFIVHELDPIPGLLTSVGNWMKIAANWPPHANSRAIADTLKTLFPRTEEVYRFAWDHVDQEV